MSEIKILSHLGHHQNILHLLGAVTQNLAMGELRSLRQYREVGIYKRKQENTLSTKKAIKKRKMKENTLSTKKAIKKKRKTTTRFRPRK